MMFGNYKEKIRNFWRGIEVPENLSSVTTIDEASEVSAEEAGLTHAPVNPIWGAVEGFFATGMHPGIGFCMRKNGKVILNRSIGYARGVRESEGLEKPILMTPQTPICLYSASKAVMAMLVHKLAEEGKVNLLNPVAHYIPEFGQAGKDKITIYQMLAHRGGFPMIEQDVPLDEMFNRESILDIIYKTEVTCPDGRDQAYHAVTSGFIADELIRRTTGKTIVEYLDEKISKPMGMKHFTYGLDKAGRDEVALNYITGMRNGKIIGGILEKALGVSLEDAASLSNSEDFMTMPVPSANLYATAEEICRFYQMLLDDGQYGKKKIFEKLTIQTATREAGKARLDKAIKIPMRFSAGFMLGGNPLGMYGLRTHEAYGHLGFSNIFCWADPDRDISVAFLSTGKPILGSHILALPKLMHTISSLTETVE